LVPDIYTDVGARGTRMAVRQAQSLRFTRLKLVNWRNFRDVDIALEKRVFIVGPNASGKSNLLDALRFLSDLARPGSGGLQAATKSRGGFSAIRCLYARAPSQVEFKATIGTDETPDIWRYDLSLNVVKGDKITTVVSERISKENKTVIERLRDGAGDAMEFSQTLIEQVAVGKDFRDLTQFLASCRYTHVVPQKIRDRQRARALGEDPFGGDLLRRMKEMPKKTRQPRLRRIAEALKIAVPQFNDLDLKDDAEGVPHLFASFEHWRGHAALQSETAFCDGTLRLIGLLWAIAERGGPLLLEEPELSLNDGIIQQLPRMFHWMQRLSGRQVIATTHAAVLLDDVDIGLKEVHRIFVDSNGSHVETLSDNAAIVAEVENETTVGQAVMPLIKPRALEKLGQINV
jgi:predicted ATPase